MCVARNLCFYVQDSQGTQHHRGISTTQDQLGVIPFFMALLELHLCILSRQEFGHRFLMHGYDAKYIPLATVWEQPVE